jgi:hypothetical protein
MGDILGAARMAAVSRLYQAGCAWLTDVKKTSEASAECVFYYYYFEHHTKQH